MILMTAVLDIFRALADPTRLRILTLLEGIELAIGEVAQVIGQSQPRVSRHVRILIDAGLVDRRKEGGWAFLKLADSDAARAYRAFANETGRSPEEQSIIDADRGALAEVNEERNAAARRYFADHAEEWDAIRSLYAPDDEIESAMAGLLGPRPLGRLLDIGTGTGRMVELFASQAKIAVAFDRSSEMLRIARAKLAPSGTPVEFVQGDFNTLPFERAVFDTVILHQVLHYSRTPNRVIAEVARVLAPGGIALFADFAPHMREDLRTGSAHARLGFAHEQMGEWLRDEGMQLESQTEIGGGELTVCLWLARRGAEDGAGEMWHSDAHQQRHAA